MGSGIARSMMTTRVLVGTLCHVIPKAIAFAVHAIIDGLDVMPISVPE